MTDALAPHPMTRAEVDDLLRRARAPKPYAGHIWYEPGTGRRVSVVDVTDDEPARVRYRFAASGRVTSDAIDDFMAVFRRWT